MITIKEIAELAGVSRGTVDRVVNNRGSVHPSTELTIKKIIEKYDYRPNKTGVALAAQKKKYTIGVIFFDPDKNNPFFTDVMKGVAYQKEQLRSYGCKILVRRTSFSAQSQLDAIAELLNEEIQGLIITPYNAPEIASRINQLSQMGIPTITVNTDIACDRILYYGSNYYNCGRIAGGLISLITGGQAKIGIITGSPYVLCHTERIAGFIDTIQNSYPDIHISFIIENDDSDTKSYLNTYHALRSHPEVDALFFAAAGVSGGCKAVEKLSLERKIKIIAFDLTASTIELVKRGIISAAIDQQPFLQGSEPIKLMFDHLTIGELPTDKQLYTEASIKIKENLDHSTEKIDKTDQRCQIY